MNLILNGQQRSFAALAPESSLTSLVTELGLKVDRVAIERNGEIVPRSEWDVVFLQNGDRLEMVHFVGGGSL
nr:sulfur carrier protein ThiS [Terriglobus saanensis]